MSKRAHRLKPLFIIAFIAVLVFVAIFGGLTLTKNLGNSSDTNTTENPDKNNDSKTSEKATEKLDKLYSSITVNNVTPRKEPVVVASNDVGETLPSIDKYPASVNNNTDSFIEIFASVEKTGDKTDGWLNDVAKEFNKANIVINDKPISVRIRGMASGTAMDYITSGKYVPDAYTPSNELWGDLAKSKGTDIKLVEKKLLGNVPGILLSKAKYDQINKKYGSINLKNIVDATVNGEIAMGYTNPLSSSTGLNFLVSTLGIFDPQNPLSDTAVSNFEKFQANIPFVSYTTLQMRDSAESGVLDGFIMEYQTYVNSTDLKSDYVFTPFGYRHDSPLYSVGNLTPDKSAILTKFIEFCKQDKYQKLAGDYGFNQQDNYVAEGGAITGETIKQALKIWKDKKNGTRNIAAVFVADVSGSMEGEPLNKLKDSLLKGSQYISKESSIGLVTYSNDVNINLPIGKFDINQRSLFTGAVKDLEAGGNTATFDGVIVAAKMLLEEKAKDPNAKLMLFVLSDGETNRGNSLDDIKDILEESKIPVYTIGYNANIEALQSLSNINEAASIDADTEDVIYKLSNLFNAEM
ncbi:MAG: VWA domain-containing protein [Clostridiaceae bacterium]